MASPNTVLTADTVTRDQIHEHMAWLESQPYIGAEQRRAIHDGILDCYDALTIDGHRCGARERVAAAINARNAKEIP